MGDDYSCSKDKVIFSKEGSISARQTSDIHTHFRTSAVIVMVDLGLQ